MGEVLFLCLGRQIEQQKIKKIKCNVSLDGCRLIFFHIRTTNQKHADEMEKRWDRMRNQTGM
jgi:hypothetical protein